MIGKFLVNSIIPMSFVDGPGCRTAIFLQSCNVRCLYCHNPETQRKCFNCGKCVSYCRNGALQFENERMRYLPDHCIDCDECIKHCANFSSPKTRLLSPQQLFAEVAKNALFIDGVTFSGGECSLQADSIIDFVKIVRQSGSLKVLIDSNCVMAPDVLQKLVRNVDGFIADLKCFDNDKHQQLVGCANNIVLENIKLLAAQKKLVEVRTVIVPGFNDNADEIFACAEFIDKLPGTFAWKLIGFRNFGVRGQLAKLPHVTADKLAELAGYARLKCRKTILTV
ncbi:MAG: YjjW family glycine radical enzyme activase [Bacillota bacterium]